VLHLARLAEVLETPGETLDDPAPTVHLGHQHHPAVRADPTPGEGRDDLATAGALKQVALSDTVCGQGLPPSVLSK
jgi:hypothetical protein